MKTGIPRDANDGVRPQPMHHQHPTDEPDGRKTRGGHGHRGHGLMMIACCIPMLVIVGFLVLTGAAGSGAIFYAIACTAMMAMMMLGMGGAHRH